MSFWQNSGLQPKRKFRYLVVFGGNTTDPMTVAVKTTEKPKFEIGNTPYKFLNHQFHFPNRLVWQPLAMTLVDHLGDGDVFNSVTGRLFKIIEGSGYINPAAGTSFEACKTAITKAAATTALGKVHIQQLADLQGGSVRTEVVETWTLHNAFINDINFGDLSYDDDGLVEISLTLVYDYATLAKDFTKP